MFLFYLYGIVELLVRGPGPAGFLRFLPRPDSSASWSADFSGSMVPFTANSRYLAAISS